MAVDPVIKAMLEEPIGDKRLSALRDALGHIRAPEALEAARRASKTWLPEGKRSTNSKARKQEFREQQIDLEDAVEAAGGQRGEARPKA